mgnify:FL=1
MKKLCLFAVVLLVAGCASNGGYDGGNSYQKLSQSLDDIHSTAQKIKETKEEYRRYENEGDDYWKNRARERWEQRRYDLKYKGERLKQDWEDIFG